MPESPGRKDTNCIMLSGVTQMLVANLTSPFGILLSLPSPSLRSMVVLACGVSSRPSPTVAGLTSTFVGFGRGDGSSCSPTSRGIFVVCTTKVAGKGIWNHMLGLPPLCCVLACLDILMLSIKTKQGQIYVNYEKFQDKNLKTYEGTNSKNTSQPTMKLCCRSAEVLQIEAKNMRLKFPTVMRLLSHQPKQLKVAAMMPKVNHTTQIQTGDES